MCNNNYNTADNINECFPTSYNLLYSSENVVFTFGKYETVKCTSEHSKDYFYM